MSVKGIDVKVGDDLTFLGKPHRITDIEPYVHPEADERGWAPGWRIAYARTPGQMLTKQNRETTWGITLEPDSDYETG